MILSSLVSPDPEGFIQLDKNLGRHLGERNVEAFHSEVGDLAMDHLLSNPAITKELLNDRVIVKELSTAVHQLHARARGRSLSTASADSAELLVKTVLQSAGGKSTEFTRDIVADEILTNPVINDRTMRNPVIMRELNTAVTKAFTARKEQWEKAEKAEKAE